MLCFMLLRQLVNRLNHKKADQILDFLTEINYFRFYGCGLVAPEALDGMHILDLGSGSGQDCFVLSKLVGENGHVTGVDMTKEQVC